jgi:hypothetical protein
VIYHPQQKMPDCKDGKKHHDWYFLHNRPWYIRKERSDGTFTTKKLDRGFYTCKDCGITRTGSPR